MLMLTNSRVKRVENKVVNVKQSRGNFSAAEKLQLIKTPILFSSLPHIFKNIYLCIYLFDCVRS